MSTHLTPCKKKKKGSGEEKLSGKHEIKMGLKCNMLSSPFTVWEYYNSLGENCVILFWVNINLVSWIHIRILHVAPNWWLTSNSRLACNVASRLGILAWKEYYEQYWGKNGLWLCQYHIGQKVPNPDWRCPRNATYSTSMMKTSNLIVYLTEKHFTKASIDQSHDGL